MSQFKKVHEIPPTEIVHFMTTNLLNAHFSLLEQIVAFMKNVQSEQERQRQKELKHSRGKTINSSYYFIH